MKRGIFMSFTDKVKDCVRIANQAVDFAKNLKKEGKEFHIDEFWAVGTSYYTADLKKVLKQNKEFKSSAGTIVKNGHAGYKIFQYEYLDKPAKLIPEPKNEHDKNAVMVTIDGKKVGYIKREECSAVKDILKGKSIEYINAFVTGGKYKVVSVNKDVFEDENGFTVRIKIGYYK